MACRRNERVVPRHPMCVDNRRIWIKLNYSSYLISLLAAKADAAAALNFGMPCSPASRLVTAVSKTRRAAQPQVDRQKTTTMTNRYHIQFPTRGDLAREQLRRRGVRYWVDELEKIHQRLEQFTEEQRKIFALGCAERVMRFHESLPVENQREYSLTWRPILDLMWDGFTGEKERVDTQVKAALEAFTLSQYYHDDGQEGPDDADEDSAAASIYAVQCYVSGEVKPAYEASRRAIGVALQIADGELQLDPNEFEWDPRAEPMPLAKEAMHVAVQAELDKQFEDITVIAGREEMAEVIRRLRR